ncbi:uracil-DNA glycosylase [Candidatus Peregrinibacteria bacterium]|nr:MAG: uracil-DNA glycosylase [Candidatus Peregrinibacteria bacterium]
MTGETSQKIETGWKNALSNAFQEPSFLEMKAFLTEEIQSGKTVYPPPKLIFHAFDSCPFEKTKVVILGQDPYHGVGQAHGLCFSVNRGVRVPPSLQNIYKELQSDMGCSIPSHGNLEYWSQQGILLLNAVLSVRAKSPASHAGKGWEAFTDAAIKALSDQKEGIIFLLWGRYAQEKGRVIDPKKHFILTAAHPSPFSASNGFFGCRHFSKTNEFLTLQGKIPIDWQIPSYFS